MLAFGQPTWYNPTVKQLQPNFPIYPVETIRDLLFKATDRYGDKETMKSKKDGKYQGLTFREVRRQTEEISTALFELGFEKGDRVAILGENRTEWAISYLAVTTAGFVGIPIDRELKEREIRHILSLSEARALLATDDHVRPLKEDRDDLPMLETIVSMEENRYGADLSFPEALDKGSSALSAGNRRYAEVTVTPDDSAVILFTSGTTGSSKGVVLTHRNIASNVMGTSYHVSIHRDDVVLSVLPLHHTYECTAGFLIAIYQGAEICYAESLRRIADNLRETKATVLLGVPALFEAIFRRIETGIREKGQGKFTFAKGICSVSEKLLRLNIRRKVFKQIHDKVGGGLRLLISGGAAIDPKVSEGFRKLGINFIQGYGLTETSPIISVNRVDHFKDDSIGVPLPDTEVKIVNDEIVVRGPGVMKGYFRNESATRETLKDGWLHTGDLGYFDKQGFLHVSGRQKSVIVTPNGKNVYPEEIESLLIQSPYILESLVWGGPEEDPSMTEVQAILVPDTEAFDKEFEPSNYDEEKLNEVLSGEVRRINKELARFKRIKKFILRDEEFEKTTTRKIKRYLYTAKTRPLKRR
jgi:long-chain acyl-CoA synthetase